MGKVILTGKGRRWLLNGHPWIYRDDIAGGEAEPGELLPVEAPDGGLIGWGLYSSSSKIAVRLVSREAEQPNREFWMSRLARCLQVREELGYLSPEGACRLVNGDSEGFPGWVVDHYAGTIAISSTVQAADRMRDFLIEILEDVLPWPIECIVERADSSVRRLESLEQRVEVIKGELPESIIVQEDELRYEVDVLHGHKTGHYLDQRENRKRAALRVEGKAVLDAFSYDGLFGIRAALAGARSVTCVDQSKTAGERVLRNAILNEVQDRVSFEKGNCMQDLRRRAEEGERYDLVVIDPPAFARNRREQRGAERGYVELNRRAMSLLNPGGRLVSASCSYNVQAEDFLKYINAAANIAGRRAYLEQLCSAAPDHPVLMSLPESSYLKCAFLRVE